jgi:predicted TIM-barrel fold metal-dependent hydrolase
MEQSFAAMDAIARTMGWHVEVIAPIAVLAGGAGVIERAQVPVVIDHYGIYGNARPESAEGRALLELMRQPHVWIKLSAPYRVSDNPLETKPDQDWVSALLGAAPDRCVWGSDWPHTPPHELCKGPDIPVPYRTIGYDRMVDDFIAAVGNAQLAERVMSDNAARLYEFARA